TRRAVLLAPLAVLPDLDALFGLHRALGHSFIPILVLPMAILAYSRYMRPEWMPAAVLAQFYLASHVVLDLGGVAFLWPIVQEQFYVDLGVTLTAGDGFRIDFTADAGTRELADMGTTYILSDFGFALLFLAVLCAAVYRKEFASALRRLRILLASLPALLRR
ncbi:MAG: metal-dependent hydrolase, partial [Thermoplasmata archaeon]|nr:metal-dependent hydrolase [Thermoplasmata archaeon]